MPGVRMMVPKDHNFDYVQIAVDNVKKSSVILVSEPGEVCLVFVHWNTFGL